MMHKNNEKIAFYLISLLLSLYYVYFADTNTFHYFTIKIMAVIYHPTLSRVGITYVYN